MCCLCVTGKFQIKSSEEKDQGKYECVAENAIGTEYSKSSQVYVKVRRVPPQFSKPPNPVNEVMLGADLNLTCVAVGSPMPFVKWRKGAVQDLTPEDNLPVGVNNLVLTDIQESANYTCIAASSLGIVEAVSQVKVQCKCFYLCMWSRVLILKFIKISIACGTNKCTSFRDYGNLCEVDMVVRWTRRSSVLHHSVQAQVCESGVQRDFRHHHDVLRCPESEPLHGIRDVCDCE